MAAKVALAIGAHPDDIEFMMAGTLVLRQRAGYQTHYPLRRTELRDALTYLKWGLAELVPPVFGSRLVSTSERNLGLPGRCTSRHRLTIRVELSPFFGHL